MNPTDFGNLPMVRSQIVAQPRLRLAYDDGSLRACELTGLQP